ncbi:MAG TPA: heptaprenyl diphosphate synthase component 1 [Bacillota bacterium]|nr:heptaprenyl diphosphate synthase component 1 [Bacillota bacterium]
MLSRELKQFKQQIENKMNHKYVDIYVQRPPIDDVTLEFLYYGSSSNEKQFQEHIMATILVQTALSAHELVRNEEDYLLTDEQKKEKQLLVLAGDYYSGLYYLLLSEIKDVQMVDCLAKGIQAVNEKKMQLYYSEYKNTKELIDLLIDIHTTIMTRVSNHLFQSSVSYMIDRVTRLHFLMQELDRDGLLMNRYIDQHDIYFRENKQELLNKYIHEHVQEIEAQLGAIRTLPTPLKQVIQRYLNNYVYDISTAEEG